MGAYGEAIVVPFGKGNPLYHHPCGGLARRRRALVVAGLAGPAVFQVLLIRGKPSR